MSEVAVQTEWVSVPEVKSPRSKPGEDLKGTPRLKRVDRQQLMFRAVDVEQLIEEDHPARAIWAFTGRMDWSRFHASIQAAATASFGRVDATRIVLMRSVLNPAGSQYSVVHAAEFRG